MRLTLLFVNAPNLDKASSSDIYRTVFDLPDAILTRTDLRQQSELLCHTIASLTCVSLYVTCRALGWNKKVIKQITSYERRRAVWNAAIFGFEQNNPADSIRGRYLKIPFSITPPFPIAMFRKTRKQGSIRRAVRQSLTPYTEEQEDYLADVALIANIGLEFLNCEGRQFWSYVGFHPDRFDVSLYRQFVKNEAMDTSFFDPIRELVSESESDSLVYFIQQGENGPIKIGYSADPLKRLQTLSTASPYPLQLLTVVPGGKALEQDLHARFVSCQLEGEWFAPDNSLLEFIASLDENHTA